MSLFHQQVNRDFDAIENEAGDQATYKRGSNGANVIAIITEPNSMTSNTGGQTAITQRTTGILIRPKRLKFGGKMTRPVNGDLIYFPDLNRRFKVVADPATRACWRYSDGGKTFFRIHADEVKASETP